MNMRERILEKAEEMFTQYGVKRITMDEIATRLGISKKTIYQSFADKNELVAEIFNKHIGVSRQNCIEDCLKSENAVHEVVLGSEAFQKTMQSINPNVLYDLEKYHPDTFKRFVEYKNEFLYTCLHQNLVRGMQEGLYRADLNPEIITRMRLASILLPVNIEVFPVHQFSLLEVEWEITAHFLHGIMTNKGAEILAGYLDNIQAGKPTLN